MKLFCLAGMLAVSATFVLAGDTKLPELAQIKIAAEQGDPAAQLKLAERYYSHADLYNAEVWFRKAALQGLAEAQYRLAGVLSLQVSHKENDKPVTRKPNPEEAVGWNQRAANQGHAGAQSSLGRAYQDGKGVKQDYVQAYKWYELATRNKNYSASYRDALILKMSSKQVAQGQKLADAFVVQPQQK